MSNSQNESYRESGPVKNTTIINTINLEISDEHKKRKKRKFKGT